MLSPSLSESTSLCCDRQKEREMSKTRFRSTTSPSAVLSMLSKAARGAGSCFGLLLIKPIMSWKVSLHCVCVRVSDRQWVTERRVCGLNKWVKIQFNQPKQQAKKIPPLTGIIGLSIIQNFNRQRLQLKDKAQLKLQLKENNFHSRATERFKERQPLADNVMKRHTGSVQLYFLWSPSKDSS